MEIDLLTFELFAGELEEKLVGVQIQKIFQLSDFEFIFRFRLPGENYFLLFSLQGNNQRIHPVPCKFAQSKNPSPFCMSLRKHLEGGRVLYVTSPRKDRILHLSITRASEEKILTLELTGKTSNLLLLDHNLKYVTAFNRKDSRREIVTGNYYTMPPPPAGINPVTISRKNFLMLLKSEKFKNVPIKDMLVREYIGVTKGYALEILFHSGIGSTTPLQNLSNRQKETLWNSWQSFFSRFDMREVEPTVYFSKKDVEMKQPPVTWTPWEFETLADYPSKKVDSMGGALEEYFFPRSASQRFEGIQKDLISIIKKRIKKVKRRIKNQEKDLEGAQKAEVLKKRGELLLANLHKINRGEEEVEVDDYYQDPPQPMTIKLDPTMSGSDNAQEYFRRYKKAKRGQSIVKKRLRISSDELEQLENLLYQVESAEDIDELEDLSTDLVRAGIHRVPRKGKKGKTTPPSGPRKFKLDQGYVALVGKNSRQNEQLTMKTASDEDMWFHARQMPGSHVVLRIQKPSKEIPDKVIYNAAQLAAYYSKGRNSTKVPVDYTRVKNVRKGKGQKPGKVFYTGEKTIIAKPSLAGELIT